MKHKQVFSYLAFLMVGFIIFSITWAQITGMHRSGKGQHNESGVNPAVSDTFWIRYYTEHPGINSVLNAEVNRFYSGRNYRPAWFDGRNLSADAGRYLALLENSSIDGLDKNDYYYSKIQLLLPELDMKTWSNDHANLRAGFDIMLTRSFLAWSHDLQVGRTIRNLRDNMEHKARHKADYVALLNKAITTHNFLSVAGKLRPQNPQYEKLSEALVNLRRDEQSGNWNAITYRRKILPGDTSLLIPEIRERLELTGDYMSVDSTGNPNIYDPELGAAVRSFQKRFGIEPDGIIDKSTVTALNLRPSDMIDKIRVNMDRLRQVPVSFDEKAVVVNLPDYTLSYYNRGKMQGKMKVIIGDLENNTPMLDDTIEYIVFSPKWKVPERISVEEMLPKIKKDTSYLNRHHYELFSGSRRVFPSEVDWKNMDKEYFPYRIEQEPGPFNALGRIKFIFPNNESIYLHDTPSSYLFAKNERHFSHGCVRIQKPRMLAEWMLKGYNDTITDSIDSFMRREKPKIIYLKKKIPVYFLYSTVWVDQSGKLNFRKDIYGLDRLREEYLGDSERPVRQNKDAVKKSSPARNPQNSREG